MVTSVPTDSLPNVFSWGASTKEEIEMMDNEPSLEQVMAEDINRRGQILWIRGLTRLQHQVRDVTVTNGRSLALFGFSLLAVNFQQQSCCVRCVICL